MPRAPVLEEALKSPTDSIALGRSEEVVQLLTEGPPLDSDTGRQDICHPLQRGESR